METADFPLAELVNEHTFIIGFANRVHNQSSVPLNPGEVGRLLRRLPLYIHALRAADLNVTVQYAEAALRDLQNAERQSDGSVVLSGANLGDIQVSMTLIAEGIRAELNTKSFVAVPPARRHLFNDGKHFGAAVADKFPSLAFNINEAGKCLALGRWTAAGYHSILCLEGALRGITRHLGIADPTTGPQRNWSVISQSIREEMKRRWPTKAEELSPHFVAVGRIHAALTAQQNPYRNETMHLSSRYDESEAALIFELTKGILQQAAALCDENGEPKLN
jgi:hypothetical protein